MGQKTHPIGFRLGTTRDWSSHWFGASPKDYREQVMEDHNIRAYIEKELGTSAGISLDKSILTFRSTSNVSRFLLFIPISFGFNSNAISISSLL